MVPPPPSVIAMRDVTAWRGETPALDGLTLEIPAGRHTAILGPNGSGKSTLLKLLSREIEPERREGSELFLFGRARWEVWELRARIGIVSHDLQSEYARGTTGERVVLSGFRSTPGVWPHHRFTARERDRTREVLEQLGIGPLAEKRYSAMSTGEQRRLLLARALVHDPELLVLDEPTSGLDLRAAFQYLEIVRTLMRTSKTVVLVTHHLHEIPPEIGWVILLRGGRLVAEGAKEEMLTSPRLSDLFETPIEVVGANGFLQALPG